MVRGDAWAEVGAMDLVVSAWAAPKRWAVAGPKACVIPAWAACSKDQAVASSMVQAACSKDLAVATSMVHARAQQACPKELSVPSSMVLQGAMACSMSKLASSKNRAPSWPTCFSAP